MNTPIQNPRLFEVDLRALYEPQTLPAPAHGMDLKKFTLMTGGFQEIMHETAAAFVEFMPGMLHDLKTAVDANDTAITEKLLHKIKSSVSLLCTDGLSAEVIDLERNSGSVATPEFKIRTNQLTHSIRLLVYEVLQFLCSQRY
jgi:hypothetical protein